MSEHFKQHNNRHHSLPPVLPPSESRWITISTCHMAHYGQTWRHPQNRTMATGNMYTENLQVWTRCFKTCYSR